MLVGSSSRAGIRIRKVVGKVGGTYCIRLLLYKVGSSVASIKRCTASLVISNVCGGELFPIRLLSISMAKLLVVSHVQDIISPSLGVCQEEGARGKLNWMRVPSPMLLSAEMVPP